MHLFSYTGISETEARRQTLQLLIVFLGVFLSLQDVIVEGDYWFTIYNVDMGKVM